MLAVRLKKHELSVDVQGTGGLVVERRVGGGRIVQTAFALDDRYLLHWKNYDGFLNGALLRRPSRDFQPLENLGNLEAKPLWVLPVSYLDNDGGKRASAIRLSTTNPMFTSTLRYFSRDVGYRNVSIEDEIRRQLDDALHGNDAAGTRNRPSANPPLPTAAPPGAVPRIIPPTVPSVVGSSTAEAGDEINNPSDVSVDNRLESKDWRFGGYSASNLSGVAGWNDFSGVAHDVRLAMQEAAGIKIPSAQFVLKMIGIYLAVLVPLNWLLFRLIGRVEWAWIATPVIAVVGTVVVIQQAQLDIGFLRSRREVAILETQADYPRGHLTRYALLYTYLGTGYDLTLTDPNTLAQPFAKNPSYVRGTYENARLVHYRRDSDLRLRNFFVPSYSSEMVHTEQMFELGGAVRLEGDDATDWEILNGSSLTMHGAAVLYCPSDADPGNVQVAWVGDLKPGVSLPLRFQPRESQEDFKLSQWSESPVTSSATGKTADGEIRLTGLMALATKKLLMFPGDVRLVAWTDEELPGIEFSPTAAQTTARTVILSHLRRGNLPPAARDQNVRTDYREPPPIEDPTLSPDGALPPVGPLPSGKPPTP